MSPGVGLGWRWLWRIQCFQKLFAKSIEAAIGHDQQQVVGFGVCRQKIGHGFAAGDHVGFFAKSANALRDGFRIEAVFVAELLRAKDSAQRDAVCECERLRQRLLENFSAHGIGAWFENRPQAAIGPAPASGFDGGAYGGRVMRKIVNDKNSLVLAFDVETTANGTEGRERFLQKLDSDASSLRDDDRGERVQYIVAAGSGHREFAKEFPFVGDMEFHRVTRKFRFAGNPVVFRGKAVSDYRAECFGGGFAQRRTGFFRVAPNHNTAIARHEVDQAFESEFVGVEVGIDVGVIVFERRDDEIVGMVMEEFRSAIPEICFVLVSFENHFDSLSETVTFAEVVSDATDEESRLLACGLENPGEHRRGGGFSMRAADNDGMFTGKKHFFKNFRHGAIRNFTFESFFELGISARNDVANDHEIRRGSEMRCFEGWKIRNPETLE